MFANSSPNKTGLSRQSSSALKRVLRPASGHHLLPSSFCFSFDSSRPRRRSISRHQPCENSLSSAFSRSQIEKSCLDGTEGIFDLLKNATLSYAISLENIARTFVQITHSVSVRTQRISSSLRRLIIETIKNLKDNFQIEA